MGTGSEERTNRGISASVRKAAGKYAGRPEMLVTALAEVQRELGHLPAEALREVARLLEVPPSRVYGVATFYSLLSVKPRGRHVIRVCESAPCHVLAARKVVEALEGELGIKPGETTSDGLFTLEFTSCLGVCGVAPAVMVDDRVYGNLSPQDIPRLIRAWRRGRGEDR